MLRLSRSASINLCDRWSKSRAIAIRSRCNCTATKRPELVRELVARGFTVWKALSGDAATLTEQARVYTDAGASALVVDAREISSSGTIYGGTGHLADWNAARALVDEGYRVILAGGLTPDNVARAIEIVRPWGVDVVSGVEALQRRQRRRKGARLDRGRARCGQSFAPVGCQLLALC